MDELEAKKYNEKQFLRTWVRHGEKWFFVSTINRLCSSDYPTEFAETMAWEWDNEKNERCAIVGELSGPYNSPFNHFFCVESLLTKGLVERE